MRVKRRGTRENDRRSVVTEGPLTSFTHHSPLGPKGVASRGSLTPFTAAPPGMEGENERHGPSSAGIRRNRAEETPRVSRRSSLSVSSSPVSSRCLRPAPPPPYPPLTTPPTVHRSPCSLFTPPQGPRFPCPFPHHTRGAFRRSPLTPGTGPSPAPLVLPPVGLSLRSRPPVGRTAPRVSVTREGAGPPVKRASRETDGLWLVPLSLTTCLSSL